ncbi:SH3 domain-containing RING finger protein 3-like [Scleropages formosus]|uniref:RING-type E3 ubiquitin transferase n=1 Tax=Scleropages formosus TaxID=113540 RepID=A0A0P7YIE7_SCLFO|nr:SH3 domain-containing RING finger protein 3-like [Scleropages formosus]
MTNMKGMLHSGELSEAILFTVNLHPAVKVENVPQLPCGKALYSYEGKEPGDLKFTKGDIIILRRKVDENWYHGELNGSHGFLPASYIQCIKPLAQPPPQGKALYDFEVKDKDQDKDCLTFTKDEILTVIRRVDENWAEGMLGDKIGIFPILYVELNETAKQLMEMDKSILAPGPSSEPGSTPGPSSGPSTTLNGSDGPGAGLSRRADGKKNAKKRHSFTALSITQRTAQALSNRHSMEISAPVLISSSDPRAAARIGGDCPHLSSSAPSQDSSSFVAGTPSIATVVPPRGTGELLVAAKVQLPLNIYLAMYAYKPQKADELELRKGEMYRVTEKCQDGWFKGTSLRSGASGVFPGNYVTPVSRYVWGGQAAKAAPGSPGSSGPSSPSLLGPSSRSTAAPLASPPTSSSPSSSSSSPPPQHPTAAVHLKNCLRAAGQQTVSQARTALQLAHSPPAGSPERPAAVVSPLRPQGSPSRCPGPAGGPFYVLSPQHVPVTRPAFPLTSAAAAVTPPNVSAAQLGGEASGGPLQLPSPAHAQSAVASLPKLEEKKAEKGAAGPAQLHPASGHGRAGSCPIESEMQGAMGLEPLHRKSGSLDLNFSVSPPARQPSSALLAVRPEPKPLSRERRQEFSHGLSSLSYILHRYRVVVPYPPQSEAEIELKEGDIVFVHKKREDGWYKGTLQRTGRTGLFPGSFVEIF